ncbi:dethiobiotin synthase [Swingsia samuiensis]|uniref:ATP-dependent dethiobiotin synthetase BioD n=1 Tax=Swingsia samuiensis TaxID=1293412 RepID=A0A4Y6UJX8_9PROT|nr:dethiobiotin synthase [Swingsia samuiensis]QDH17110.1 dethiobiotin synthase [Swingsia samuiensis]
MTNSRGVFITGTDTEIGKTLTSAILTKAWNTYYWKPLQTGLETEQGDSPTVASLAQLPPKKIIPPAYSFKAPLSPMAAASKEHTTINPGRLVLPQLSNPILVEGAGGLMVPIRKDLLMIDLINKLDLPTILVARSGLGTINHTLLSLEALTRRNIHILGVVLSGPLNTENKKTIEEFGNTKVILQIPHLDVVNPTIVTSLAQEVPDLRDI